MNTTEEVARYRKLYDDGWKLVDEAATIRERLELEIFTRLWKRLSDDAGQPLIGCVHLYIAPSSWLVDLQAVRGLIRDERDRILNLLGDMGVPRSAVQIICVACGDVKPATNLCRCMVESP